MFWIHGATNCCPLWARQISLGPLHCLRGNKEAVESRGGGRGAMILHFYMLVTLQFDFPGNVCAVWVVLMHLDTFLILWTRMALVYAKAGDVRDRGSVPGSGRSPGGGQGNALQYSCLENPMTEEPGGLQSIGSQRGRHNWGDLAYKTQVENKIF